MPLVFISLFLVSYSSYQKSIIKTTSIGAEKKELKTFYLQSSKKGKKPRKINTNTPRGRRERNRYKCQLEIATGNNEFSYFNRNKLSEIALRIPLPNDKFRLYRSYNISNKNNKGILLVITDNTADRVEGIPSHILDTIISTERIFNFKNKKPLELKSKDELTVFVLNENKADFLGDSLWYLKREYKSLKRGDYIFCNKSISDKIISKKTRSNKVLLPDQKGGGVIVEDEDEDDK